MITITNPLVAEESVLRTSLRPGLLQAIAFNESHRRTGVRLFEIGHVYPPGEGELPDEYEALCVVLAGEEAPAAMAVWREISSALGVGARDRPGRSAGRPARRRARRRCRRARTRLGAVGEVDPAVLERFDVSERVAILELDLDQVLGREPKPAAWKPISRYPSSDLDLAFVLPDDVPAERLEKAIRQGAGALLVDVELFDVFRARVGRRGASQPRLPPPAAGAGPQPHRRRHRRGAPRRRRSGARSWAPICEADDDAGRTRSRRGCWPRSTCSSARGCSRS